MLVDLSLICRDQVQIAKVSEVIVGTYHHTLELILLDLAHFYHYCDIIDLILLLRFVLLLNVYVLLVLDLLLRADLLFLATPHFSNPRRFLFRA